MLTPQERSIISKGLSISPVGRWPSSGEMISRLSEVAADMVNSHPDGTAYA
jgi:hypothetical protein